MTDPHVHQDFSDLADQADWKTLIAALLQQFGPIILQLLISLLLKRKPS